MSHIIKTIGNEQRILATRHSTHSYKISVQNFMTIFPVFQCYAYKTTCQVDYSTKKQPVVALFLYFYLLVCSASYLHNEVYNAGIDRRVKTSLTSRIERFRALIVGLGSDIFICLEAREFMLSEY